MFVFDQILDESGRRIIIPLVTRSGYPGHVCDEVLGFGSYVDEFDELGHKKKVI
jgi:hypothetical protein